MFCDVPADLMFIVSVFPEISQYIKKTRKGFATPRENRVFKGNINKILRRSFDGYSPYLSFTPILDGAYALCLVSVEHKATKMGKVGEGFV